MEYIGYQTLLGLEDVQAGNIVTNSLTVDSLNGVLKASSGLVSGSATTTDLPEGTGRYFTEQRVVDSLTGVNGIVVTQTITPVKAVIGTDRSVV
jgi:hypothetical protein